MTPASKGFKAESLQHSIESRYGGQLKIDIPSGAENFLSLMMDCPGGQNSL